MDKNVDLIQRPAGPHGDIADLVAYYNRHFDDLHRYASSIVRDHSLAEDMVHQAFINTLESIERGVEIRNLSGWLKRCIHNLCVSEIGRESTTDLAAAATVAMPSTCVETVMARQGVRAVEEAVDDLPRHMREAFLLAEIRGLAYDEIASAMGRSVGSVAQMLRRARARVREGVDAGDLLLWTPALASVAQIRRHVLAGWEQLGDHARAARAWLVQLASLRGEALAAPATPLMAGALIVAAISGIDAARNDPPNRDGIGGRGVAAAAAGNAVLASANGAARDAAARRGGRPRPAADGVTDINQRRTPPPSQHGDEGPSRANGSRNPAALPSTVDRATPPPTTGDDRRIDTVRIQGYDGGAPDGSSGQPSLSKDGESMAFASTATNLVEGDGNHEGDVFAMDMDRGRTALISRTGDGTPANGPSGSPSISRDGTAVAFESLATNLAEGNDSAGGDIFVRDRASEHTDLISAAADGTSANAASTDPSLSADGRFVVFTSAATNLVAPDTPGAPGAHEPSESTASVYVRDRAANATELASVDTDGQVGNKPSFDASITASGRLVAFTSAATNLVTGDGNGVTDVFIRDRLSGSVGRVSRGQEGAEPNGPSYEPQISADGRYVVYASRATNLVSDPLPGASNVFRYDLQTRATELVEASLTDGNGERLAVQAGPRAGGASRPAAIDLEHPSLTEDGRFVVMQATAHAPARTPGAAEHVTTQVIGHDMATGRTASLLKRLPANLQTLDPAINPTGSGMVAAFAAMGTAQAPTSSILYLLRRIDSPS